MGEEEKKKDEEKIDYEKLRPLLIDTIPFIRFPVMDPGDIVMEIQPYNLLTKIQVLQLLVYLGQIKQIESKKKSLGGGSNEEEELPKPGKEIEFLNFSLRTARISGWVFCKERKNNNLVLSNHNRTVEKNKGSNQYNTVACTEWVKKGRHTVRFKIDNNNNDRWIFLGLITRQYQSFNAGSSYVGQTKGQGY